MPSFFPVIHKSFTPVAGAFIRRGVKIYTSVICDVHFGIVIEETIERIEQRLRSAESLTPSQRTELEQLIAQLRREARSLPSDALVSAPPAPGEDAQSTVNRLQESLTAFETSHPQLVGLVNRISTILANMGL